VEICIFIRAFACVPTYVIRTLLEPGNQREFALHTPMKWGTSPQLNL